MQGKEISEYIDIVNGEAIMGANISRNFFGSIRDTFGGRAGAYESKLNETRDIAMDEMKELARQKGANDIISIDVNFEVVCDDMLTVAVSGTAVRI
ncbi:heavy metal-binding domain-containing protein [Bacillus cereus]|uniref:heavy metal-binding domain-containing protein n=1 Tax=Bacillus cereus TaxID=1396 RepID=UPI002ABF9C1C|nr:heavy metal-binding domain-containing protein [Bacillus cereus]MDZ4406751.1 heavy metal-binding domain-containing protein [Bacillus cereus]MDZ4533986.1 heavy metal-binding domain-containing protein [Bacillus cereus]